MLIPSNVMMCGSPNTLQTFSAPTAVTTRSPISVKNRIAAEVFILVTVCFKISDKILKIKQATEFIKSMELDDI